jgi:DNA-directed RNA polymerase subunit RPC12/RpoP
MATTEGMKVYILKCANCGGSLEIRSDTESFACGYCGASQIVERKGGVVSLRKIEAALAAVSSSTNKTASELALVRLKGEIAAMRAEHEKRMEAAARLEQDSNARIGIASLVLVVVAIVLFSAMGWWATPLVIVGLILGYKLVPTGDRGAEVKRQNEVELAPLLTEVEKHRAIVSE